MILNPNLGSKLGQGSDLFLQESGPVPTFKDVIKMAHDQRASDIHLISDNPIKMRIDGHLITVGKNILNHDMLTGMLFPLLSERHMESLQCKQDLDLSLHPLPDIRVRMNVHYEKAKLAAAIRLLNNHIPSLVELNLPASLSEIARKHQGLVLVTGPTGHGKSTTLAAMIDHINNHESRHIITIEDPIEYQHVSKKCLVEQRELHRDTPSFKSALKYALRQDPDVILVGELRDLETIGLAITAAETGHLVLATLHTNDAPQTIDRLTDVFSAAQQPQIRQQLSMSLLAIISQLLVPREDKPGRIPVIEILKADTGVRNLIRKGRTHEIYGLMETGKANGNWLRDDSLFDLVKLGILSAKRGLELARFPNLLGQALKSANLLT